MRQGLKTAVRQWLRLEGATLGRKPDDRRAERALTHVFARLPEIPVPAGFAERVLARAGIRSAEASHWAPSLTVRLVLGLSLALGAASMLFLPGTLLWLGRLMEAFEPMEMATGALVAVSRRFGHGMAVWKVLSGVGQTAAVALSTPGVLLALAVSTLLSVAAFRLLLELMVGNRSSYHVTSA